MPQWLLYMLLPVLGTAVLGDNRVLGKLLDSMIGEDPRFTLEKTQMARGFQEQKAQREAMLEHADIQDRRERDMTAAMVRAQGRNQQISTISGGYQSQGTAGAPFAAGGKGGYISPRDLLGLDL